MASTAEVQAMTDAIALAQQALCPPGPNPRVGCVILAPDGSQVSSGAHEGAGTPHAEVVALQAAGAAARGDRCSHPRALFAHGQDWSLYRGASGCRRLSGGLRCL